MCKIVVLLHKLIVFFDLLVAVAIAIAVVVAYDP